VAAACTEYAQSILVRETRLEWVPVIDDGDDVQALVSRSILVANQEEERNDPNDNNNNPTQVLRKPKPVLLVITGKGMVRAGIFSRRLLITMGIEAATALPFLREAVRRDMDLVVLDPNARGDRRGMEVTTTSLETLFLHPTNGRRRSLAAHRDVYVLAHSMAGAQLTRFLIDKLSTTSTSEADADTSNDQTAAAVSFFQNIRAVAFTDSNHNINWTKQKGVPAALTDFLVGPACLYIKSHKVHENAKALGERHHDCQFWKHRFGNIRTLWAGTREHALTNFAARHHIWEHFDSFLTTTTPQHHPSRLVDENNGNDDDDDDDDDDEMAPTFD